MEETKLFELAREAQRPQVDRLSPPSLTRSATLCFAGSSSPAIGTSSCCPATSPGTRVFPNVVLNAFTTGVAAGTSLAVSSALELSRR